MLIQRIKCFLKQSWRDKIFLLIRKLYLKMSISRKFSKKYTFDNRSKNAENLLLIVAGFQEYYWDSVMARVAMNEKQFSEPIDICVCVPLGLKGAQEKLRKVCEKYQWSCLIYSKDQLGTAQNIAIKLHKNAKWVFKIDEDIILSERYFERMKNAYLRADRELAVKPGFLGACININAFGAEPFLKAIGKFDEFENRFGRYTFGTGRNGNQIHTSREMATWIWENTLPFDDTARRVSEVNREKVALCPYRFSIGAILFERSFWKDMGYFDVSTEGGLGAEEVQMCGYCVNNFLGMAVAEDILVGHLGFFTQKEEIRQFYMQHRDEIDYHGVPVSSNS